MEFSWSKMLGIRSSSSLLNGLGVNDGSRPWFNYVTPAVAIEPGETIVFMPANDNWATNLTATNFNPLVRGENNTGGVLRFPIPTAPGTVSWEELNANPSPIFRFGENKGASWSETNGRNYVLNLAIHNASDNADTLVANQGEPIARIERVGNGKIDLDWLLGPARGWAASGDTGGRSVQVVDSFLGNDTVPYYTDNNEIRPWARDFNPRFNFPSNRRGLPMVHGVEETNPGRSHRLWGLRYGHSGWHSRIDPVEFPPGSGSVIWGTQTSPPLGQSKIVLFDLPFGEILSPGQLQHVNLCGRDRPLRSGNRIVPDNEVNSSKKGQSGVIQSPYVVGNSYRDPSVGLADLDYDWSVLANREIWDKWFVSGISPNLAAEDLDMRLSRNRRMKFAGRGAGPTVHSAVKTQI